MSVPIPAPRQLIGGDQKKPVPAPRNNLKNKVPLIETQKSQDDNNSTFSRRVRHLSNASKQIAGDLGDLVHDKKKAVIEGTRQSVRRITRRFSNHQTQQIDIKSHEDSEEIDDNIDIFSSISFQSPITQNQSIYNNVDDNNSSSSDDYISSPPPSHPPPPLPDDSIYDAPSSLASGSTTSNSDIISPSIRPTLYIPPENYESIFPVKNPIREVANNNCSSSNSSSDCGPSVSLNLSRSESWKFYDPVTKPENIYNDVEGNSPPILLQPQTSQEDNQSEFNSNFSVEVRNSLYENHEIVSRLNLEKKRPSASVILQFDPLRNAPTTKQDLQMLEDLLQGDLYGNLSGVQTADDWSISNDSEELEDFINPPPPPIRVDSLPEDEQAQSQPSTPKEGKNRTSWFTGGGESLTRSTSSSSEIHKKSGWFKNLKEVLPDVVKGGKNRDVVVQRPELEVKSFIHKKGMLYKVQGGPVEDLFGEYSGRWCVLENSSLICYSDSNEDSIKEHFPSESILSIQILQDSKFKYKYDNDELHCFELNTTGRSRGGHIYGTKDISERRIWMQFLAESLTKKFSSKITTDYTRMGWTYLREGVSGKWLGAWLILSHRTLYYAIDKQSIKTMDLRKVRCMLPQSYQENENNPRTNDKGPNVVVDSPNMTLYLRMWTSRETKVWCHIIKLAAHNNGANLDQQQLTKNDIPVLVEKCVNFIYSHGSMTEGIYRRPGVGSAVSEILSKFRKDAWAVQLTADKYTEHDVATALKRFFRDLPEPLLSSSQRQYFYQVSLVKDKEEKIRMYKAALDYLPPNSFKTAKKLLGHLHFIASQSAKNLMNADNLASLWGPTLMHYEDKNNGQMSSGGHAQDTAVVKQLIENYRYIFPEDPKEIEQEKIMLQVLERYTKSPQGAVNSKKAGEFRVWIYFENKEGKTFNVAIGPNKSAFDVCVELSSKVNVPVNKLILEEVVLNEKLVRPMHHTEKVLDVVLRWGYWDEADRKDNHLILAHIAKYFDFIQDKSPVVSEELKFADSKTKHFKPYMFEFSQAKLTCYKEKSCGSKLHCWNVEDIIWFLGNEGKRSPPTRWTVTFIEAHSHPTRTKSSPFFGNVLSWGDPETRANWLASMLKARYQESLAPPALHVNLMSN